MRKLTKRSTALVAGLAVVVAGGGAAWAANGWTILGSGKANAEASKIEKMSATSTFAKKLYPNLVAQMTTKVSNPNEFPVLINSNVTVTPDDVTVTPADTTCKNGLLQPGVLTTDFPGSPKIGAGAVDQEVTSTVTVGSIPQACAGKAIEVKYAFSGVSQP